MTAPQGAPREAGRELDVFIAEKVMGYMGARLDPKARPYHGSLYDDSGILLSVPNYSTEIAAAWQVVEKLARLEPHAWMLTLMNWNYYGKRTYSAQFTSHPLGPPRVEACADSPALAICLAVLRTLPPQQETEP
jgi:hypothetical protein